MPARRSGPVVVAYDGSPAARDAVAEAGGLLSAVPALVVVVAKAGLGFELLDPAPSALGLPPAQLDVRAALEIDATVRARADDFAAEGAALAREHGLPAERLVVVDAVEIPVADSLLRVARERDARGIVLGVDGDPLVSPTARDIVRGAPCPVLLLTCGPPVDRPQPIS